jgi:prevent-host-death family protein
MAPLHVATDIVPVGELKVQAAKLLRRVREERRPVVITQHGKPAGVLISPEEYDRLVDRERFISALEEGLQDSAAGRTLTNEELTADLDRKFGPLDEP